MWPVDGTTNTFRFPHLAPRCWVESHCRSTPLLKTCRGDEMHPCVGSNLFVRSQLTFVCNLTTHICLQFQSRIEVMSSGEHLLIRKWRSFIVGSSCLLVKTIGPRKASCLHLLTHKVIFLKTQKSLSKPKYRRI